MKKNIKGRRDRKMNKEKEKKVLQKSIEKRKIAKLASRQTSLKE